MGRSIVYCDKCGQLLKEEDFRQGKASTADNRSYCSACRPTQQSTTSLPKLPPVSKVSTARIPKQPTQRLPSVSPPGGATPAVPEAPAKSNTQMMLIGGGIGVVVIGLAFVMMSGNKSAPPRGEESTQNVVAFHPPPPVDKSSPEERQLEETARAACVKAYGIRSTRPGDLAAQWRAFEEAVAASRGSSYAADATSQLEKIRRKFAEEREALESRTQDAMSRDQLKTAIGLWEADLRRYDVAEWTRPVTARIEELKAEAERRFTVALDAASDAKRRGDENEARNIRNKVGSWGLPGYAEKIDQALAAIVPDKPKPPAEDPDKAAKDRLAYLNRWKEIFGPVAAREYGDAVKLLEKLLADTKDEQLKKDCARDIENLKAAAAFLAEAVPLLPKVPKGTRLAWTFIDSAGAIGRVDDVVLKIDATRVEVKWEEGYRVIPFGEVGAATLNELTKGKSARGAAVACALEGDEEGAKKIGGDIPDYYAVLGREAAEARAKDEREARARALFYEAERDYFDTPEMNAAVTRYKTILGELSATSFARRNKAAIAARTEGGVRDILIPTGDLLSTAGFKLGKYGKVESAWVSQADLDVSKMKENYVEFGFPAAAEQEYRIWALLGGCCQEVFGCYAQGSELMGPDPTNPKEKTLLEPGANAGLFVKPASTSTKKTHAQHTGPKHPERFDWTPIASIKFAQPGLKRFRLLTNQKGFAVAQAAVLATRPGPPRDSDFKALEAWKAETPGAVPNRAAVAGGSILRELWKGVGGGGLGDLANHQAYKDDRPTESAPIPAFEIKPGVGTDYGARLRGWIHPPVSGLYVFWFTSDDQGELKLSTDDDPKNAKPIASAPEWAGEKDYGKHASQQSQPIELKAGRRYYVEAVMKQGVGGDHLSVKWRLPNGTEENPIPGTRLSPWKR